MGAPDCRRLSRRLARARPHSGRPRTIKSMPRRRPIPPSFLYAIPVRKRALTLNSSLMTVEDAMDVFRRALIVGVALGLLTSADARAQVQTGSIAGVVTDSSGGVLPGVSVSLSGDKLIGGTQAQSTDTTGAYRFDRLPPGSY